MKQCLGLWFLLWYYCLYSRQVQGGIITNQQSLTLPAELADAITSTSTTSSSSSSSSSTDNNSNSTSGARTGKVIYTASYSNVRISSKEPKNLKYFPIPAVISKKTVNPPANVVPILPKSTTTTPTTTTTTTTPSTTTTTEAQPLPDEVASEKDLSSLIQVNESLPHTSEIMEEETTGNEADEGEDVTEIVNDEVVPDSVTESDLDTQ